jgi:hypothetical protein
MGSIEMSVERTESERTRPSESSERGEYVPPAVEDIDTTYGPAETSAGFISNHDNPGVPS